MIGKWLVIAVVAILAVAGVSYWPAVSSTLHLGSSSGNSADGYAHAQVVFDRQTVQVEIPTTREQETKGLGGRTKLSDSEGMLWQYTEATQPTFWMQGMLIPLDFIWFHGNRVSQVTANVSSPNPGEMLPLYQPTAPVDGVLEVRAGFAERYQVEAGSEVKIVPE